MSKTKIGAVALLAVVPLGTLAVAATADAATPASSPKITATVSDSTPKSGQEFTIAGSFTENGKAAANHVVKVQARQADGSWKTLTGAKERTTNGGAYDMYVILNAKGQRDLRVVGVGTGSEQNATNTLSVRVH